MWKPGVRRLLAARRQVTLVKIGADGSCRVSHPQRGIPRSEYARVALRHSNEMFNCGATGFFIKGQANTIGQLYWILLMPDATRFTRRHELIHAYTYLLDGADRPRSWKLCRLAWQWRRPPGLANRLVTALLEGVAYTDMWPADSDYRRHPWHTFWICLVYGSR